MPVARRPVAGDDQRPSLPFADQLVEVASLGRVQPAHCNVVEDEDVWTDQLAEPFLPGAVGVTAPEVCKDAAGLGEADVGALADGEVVESLRDVCLADTDRPMV